MTTIPHVIAGAAIGALSPSPVVAIAGGFLSHFVLDFIPHWDPLFNKDHPGRFQRNKLLFAFLLFIDLGVSVIILLLIFQYPNMFIAAVVGTLPDLDHFLQYKFKQFPLLSKIGITIHDCNSFWHKNTTFIKAVFTQGIVTIVGLTILYLKISY